MTEAPTLENPHANAVWRDGRPTSAGPFRLVSVDYGAGSIEQTQVGRVDWARVVRWRWGWAS